MKKTFDKINEFWLQGDVNFKPIGCRLAAIGKHLYVVGRGLKTLVLNTEKAWSGSEGLLVTSSINGLPECEDVVLSCHVIEL